MAGRAATAARVVSMLSGSSTDEIENSARYLSPRAGRGRLASGASAQRSKSGEGAIRRVGKGALVGLSAVGKIAGAPCPPFMAQQTILPTLRGRSGLPGQARQ